MKSNRNLRRLGLLRNIVILLTFIWFPIVSSASVESPFVKYEVNVKPRTTSYSTHSAAVMPSNHFISPRGSMPMVSGNGVCAYPMLRSSRVHGYAYQEHALMPTTAIGPSYRLRTTSSVAVHSIGLGGSSIGTGANRNTSSSHDVSYSGRTVAMPSLSMTPHAHYSGSAASPSLLSTETYAFTTSATASQRRFGSRRAPGYAGTEEGDEAEDGGKYWYWDGEEWIDIGDVPVGTIKIEGGVTYRWNGSSWEVVGDQKDPGIPVGDTPWLWMLFCVLVFYLVKSVSTTRKNSRED